MVPDPLNSSVDKLMPKQFGNAIFWQNVEPRRINPDIFTIWEDGYERMRSHEAELVLFDYGLSRNPYCGVFSH